MLCLLPVALIGAIRGGVPFGIILETYFLLVLGTITYHALALLVSTLLGRGGMAVSIFLFLVLVGMSSIDFYSPATPWNVPFLHLHSLSPFVLGNLIAKPPSMVVAGFPGFALAYVWSDMFLGKTLSHSLVLIVLYVTFTCWFMMAITCNLKRDPSIYEVYTPGQAFLFTLYVNLRWCWDSSTGQASFREELLFQWPIVLCASCAADRCGAATFHRDSVAICDPRIGSVA